jgi:maleylacetoacetate isomerase
MAIPELYTYYRSSAAYRVRIALALKGVRYTPHFVHLARDGGQQHAASYRAINPQGLVPTFVDQSGTITQSLAIIEYLEESYPEPALLPTEPYARARVRAMAAAIACDIHPIDNLRVLSYLRQEFSAGEDAINGWYQHWVAEGLAALEALAVSAPGPFCWGGQPTLADICLVPQLYNARRFNCDLTGFPRLTAIDALCGAIPAFAGAAPERQPDSDQPRS